MTDIDPAAERRARDVSLFRLMRRSLLFWFGAAWLAGGSVIGVAGLRQSLEEREFRSASRRAEAVVTDKYLIPADRGGNPSTQYVVSYRFSAADGEVVAGSGHVDVEAWERLEKGSAIPVTYNPAAPSQPRLPGDGGDLEEGLVALILGGIFSLVGGAMFFHSLRRVALEYRLRRHGTVAAAMVLGVVPSGTTINRVRQWEVRYRYRDHLGGEHEGRSGPLPPAEAHETGGTGTVCYDPRRPERSVWAGGA